MLKVPACLVKPPTHVREHSSEKRRENTQPLRFVVLTEVTDDVTRAVTSNRGNSRTTTTPPLTPPPSEPRRVKGIAEVAKKNRGRRQTSTIMKPIRERSFSSSCCFCFHVRTGAIAIGVAYLVVYLVTASLMTIAAFYQSDLADVGKKVNLNWFSEEDGTGVADGSIGMVVCLLMITISGMLVYGCVSHRAGWMIPFLSYQLFDFSLSCLVVVGFLTYLPKFRSSLEEMNFQYKETIENMDTTWLIVFAVLCCAVVLGLKAYLVNCVWNCYKYIVHRNSRDFSVFANPNADYYLPPSYDTVVKMPLKEEESPPAYTPA
ncbi:unnamed protein product [Lampetra fluviatilis]